MVNTAVLGHIGAGKTLILSYFAFCSEREVYANFKLNLPNAHRLKTLGLDEIETNVDIFIDELHLNADSRNSNSVINRYASYEASQQRHNKADMYVSDQFFHMIDKRFRDLTETIIKCRCIGDKDNPEGFLYEFLDVETGEEFAWYLDFEEAKFLFDIYDTFEKLDPSRKLYYRLKGLKETDSGEFMKECFKISQKIKPLVDKITKDNITNTLLENDYPEFISNQVYFYLKKEQEA